MAQATLQRGKRIPNWTVKDQDGKKHVLWDYRQKSHLVLLYDPEAGKDVRERWGLALAADQKQWDWLNVKPLIVSSGPKEMAPGVYAIDRYGMFLNSFPPSRWNFDDLEKEFLYFEAYHC
jgi:hypothetical protein